MTTVELTKTPMTNDDLLKIVKAHLSQAQGDALSDQILKDQRDALNAYLGGPNGLEMNGRSKVTTTDVADAIEWVMPEVMKALTQGKDVIQFDPLYAGDEIRAEIETSFLYDILMKDNHGFVNIYQLAKDALMQRNGILKVVVEEENNDCIRDYTGITQEMLTALLNDINADVLQLTDHQIIIEGQSITVYDCKVQHINRKRKVKTIPVPPENFRIKRFHNSIMLDDCGFLGDVCYKTRSELIQEGYDATTVNSIAAANELNEKDNRYRWHLQHEQVVPVDISGLDKSQELLEVYELYLFVDLDGTGVAERMKIIAAGSNGPTEILHIEDSSYQPYVSATAILMSHKFMGLSIYDRIIEIQTQKTQLLRNAFDNFYYQNNQRLVVVKGQVELDDLLVNRPGGMIRASRADAVTPLQTPQMAGQAFQFIEYLDAMRSQRVGADPEGQVDPTQVGDRVGSNGIERLMNAKEELVGLMIRCIAETGIKPACFKIRELMMAHFDNDLPYQFKGKWVNVNPSTWTERTRCTVTVGTGTGNRQERRAMLQSVMDIQAKLLGDPRQAMVNQKQIFAAINDFIKSFGAPGADQYFINPDSDEGKAFAAQVNQGNQEKQQTDKQVAMAPVVLAQAELKKAETGDREVDLKHQIETLKEQIRGQKETHTIQIKLLESKLRDSENRADAAHKDALVQLEYDKLNQTSAVKIAASANPKKEASEVRGAQESLESGEETPDTDEESSDAE